MRVFLIHLSFAFSLMLHTHRRFDGGRPAGEKKLAADSWNDGDGFAVAG
jgi:hypothetical protein